MSTTGLVMGIILIVAGIYCSALFSGSEYAFFSLNSHSQLSDERRTDQFILHMLDQPRRLLATLLIGRTLVNIVSAVLAAAVAGSLAESMGLQPFWFYLCVVVALVLMILILVEVTPKLIAVEDPLKYARSNSRFIYISYILLKPFTYLLAHSALSLEERLLNSETNMSSEDIVNLASENTESGTIKKDAQLIIENVIEFADISVSEIMTGRSDILAFSTADTLDSVLTLIREKGLSRMPIYDNDLDNILGIIHVKDLLPYINSEVKRTTLNWRTISRKTLFIPATKKLDDLLRDFQQEKTHIAIVVNEYGGTEGLITLDDIIEEIIGEVEEEEDSASKKRYAKLRNGTYIFDTQIALKEVEELLDHKFITKENNFKTLGKFIYHLTEGIPNTGERICYHNLVFTIHSKLRGQVRKVRAKVQSSNEQRQSSSESKPEI